MFETGARRKERKKERPKSPHAKPTYGDRTSTLRPNLGQRSNGPPTVEEFRKMTLEALQKLIVPFCPDPREGMPVLTHWADQRTSARASIANGNGRRCT
jgi:hypothetical protein